MALTGFLVNQGSSWVCADGPANAILALGARFPYVAGNQPLLCSLNSSVFTAPNTFTNSITCHDLSVTTVNGGIFTASHPLTLMQCDPVIDTTPFFDGMTMGWGVVSAMAAAAAIIFIKKAFFR